MWSWLPAPHRRWILVNALIVAAVINAALNAGIAWLSVRGVEQVPLWSTGETSIGTDTLGTLFMLPLITTVLITTVVWRELREGELERIEGLGRRHRVLREMPAGRLLRGIGFGIVTFAVLALPVTAALIASGLDDLSRSEFILFKAAFAVLLGIAVTPLIAMRAMADRVTGPAASRGSPS